MALLNEVLTYQNNDVLKRYKKNFPNNKLSAKKAFYYLMQYFWLCDKHASEKQSRPNDESLKFSCIVHHEMSEIDDMWHTFLLFTQDYADFCTRYFGRFLHHKPNTSSKKTKLTSFQEELFLYLTYINEHLGEKTLRGWFAELI